MERRIERVTAVNWRTWREVRLAALLDAPSAFGSSHAETLARPEEWWLARVQRGPLWLARVGDRPVGSVGVIEEPTGWSLVGLWVAPAARGTGLGAALVQVCVEHVRAAGASRLLLDVVEDNQPALRLYADQGFVPTGRTHPHPHDPSLVQVELARSLVTPD